MEICKIFVIAVVLVASVGTTSSGPCPTGCSCNVGGVYVTCSIIGLTQPPVGYWPDVQSLSLSNNNIENLDPYGLTGFPNLKTLSISKNPLKELDLNTLATVQNLNSVTINSCNVSRVVALEYSLQMPNLRYLGLGSNSIRTLPEGIFSSTKFPKLEELRLSSNPLTLPKYHPLIESKTLKYLNVDQTLANDISSQTFKGLPKLVYLNLRSSQVSDIGDSLTYLPSLVNLFLGSNPLKAIRRGSFPNLWYVTLEGSELDSIETAALNSALPEDGIVDITNTPMACQCKHEALYWWAMAKKVWLYASCGKTECQFTRKNF